jgi:prephenate dehydrogenase
MKKPTIAIVGLGMMGGSLGLALKRSGRASCIFGIGRDAKRLQKAKALKICDRVTTDYRTGIQNADLVIICTPVDQIVPSFEKILPFLKPEALVTDIGSVKAPIHSQIHHSQFIGSHPMVGSEKTGFENANAHLYEKATVVLCPGDSVKPSVLSVLKKFWQGIGAKGVVMRGDIHDLLVAQTSHLPHVLASALVQLLSHLQKKDSNTSKLLAGSFRDMTRIVDADPEQWAAICSLNQKFLIGSLKSYQDLLNSLIQKGGDAKAWKVFFTQTKNQRRRLLA